MTLFLCVEFLLHIPCCLHFYAGSLSYTSRAVLIFMQGVSFKHPCWLPFFLFSFFFIWGISLTHIPCWRHFHMQSFSYTSHAGFIFIGVAIFMGVISLTHPMLASFLSGEFLLHIPCWLHPVLASFLYGEFLLHIPCLVYISVGSFSYTSRAGFYSFFYIFMWGASHVDFIFMWGVSVTHPVLLSFLCGEFVLHITCCLGFYAGNLWPFFYFIFI